MCLVVRRNWFQRLFNIKVKPKTAKKDIEVFKYLEPGCQGILFSPVYDQEWRLGEVEKTNLVIEKDNFVTLGFHSYLVPRPNHLPCFNHLELYNAIIPKGSHYIKGDNSDIVSDQLMIIDKYKK